MLLHIRDFPGESIKGSQWWLIPLPWFLPLEAVVEQMCVVTLRTCQSHEHWSKKWE